MPRTGLNWTPAGYLPAPLPARFISEAEQAAAALPPTIKAQSLKNALLKGGAKPVELEYAGIDDFIASRQGQSVPSQEVLDHIKAQGPLGQLKRVEQRVRAEGEPKGDWSDHFPNPGLAEDFRAPFSDEGAYPYTMYRSFTVPGKRGDFTGYREVLLEDPKNRPDGHTMELTPGQRGSEEGPATAPVFNAHGSDYWARYNEYPDRIAVQNIQSDAGQDVSKHGSNQLIGDDDGTRMTIPEAIEKFKKQRDEMQAALDAGGDQSLRIEIAERDSEIERLAQSQRPHSPLARDDNWKNLMARHIALQSIAGGGKPITLPTGQQMVDVEGFGLQTHGGNHHQAAKAADAYNSDLVRRLQKIFRGLAPEGAGAKRMFTGEPLPDKQRFPLPRPEDNTMWERHFVHDDLLPPIRDRAMRAMELADSDPDLYIWAEHPDEMNPYGFFDPTIHDEMVRIAGESQNPEARQSALEALQLWRRAGEISHTEKSSATPHPSQQPGWTITPSPQAVRAALEKGLPIMSLAPLLLAPPQEKR
jgi:hypothetical protein